MIPQSEMEKLIVAAITSAALARSGQKKVGFDWLHAGLMEATDKELSGLEWAPKLVERWRQILAAYCAEFNVNASPSELNGKLEDLPVPAQAARA